jgi:hypothetical protein
MRTVLNKHENRMRNASLFYFPPEQYTIAAAFVKDKIILKSPHVIFPRCDHMNHSHKAPPTHLN